MMFSKLSKKSAPKRILIVSLTNIGDVILTCPVIDILRRDFPEARIDVVIGPKAVSLFAENPDFGIKVFDKQASFGKKVDWFLDLYRSRYDVVVDLRCTALALFLVPRYATPVINFPFKNNNSPLFYKEGLGEFRGVHKKETHLNRLRQVYDFDVFSDKQYAIQTTKEDEKFFEGAVAPALQGKSFVVIAPGAADSAKRWNVQGFAAVADHLSATHKIVFVGDASDAQIVADIQGRMKSPALSLAGKINLRQLAYILKKSAWAVTHDSGVMHLACYFDVPVLVLWGPTDISKYAPWSTKSVIVRRNEPCLRCQSPKSGEILHNCMSFITVEDVIKASSAIA